MNGSKMWSSGNCVLKSHSNMLSQRKLALEYGINALGASRLVNGAVAPYAHVGPKEVLPPASEAELVAGLKRCIANTCAMNMQVFPAIFNSIASRLGVDKPTFTAGKLRQAALRAPHRARQAPTVHDEPGAPRALQPHLDR